MGFKRRGMPEGSRKWDITAKATRSALRDRSIRKAAADLGIPKSTVAEYARGFGIETAKSPTSVAEVRRVLRSTRHNVRLAAEELGIGLDELQAMMERYHVRIPPQRFRAVWRQNRGNLARVANAFGITLKQCRAHAAASKVKEDACDLNVIKKALAVHGSIRTAAKALDMPKSTFANYVDMLRARIE